MSRLTNSITDRRRALAKAFVRTWSLKPAIKIVSKEFKASEGALRADWNRRDGWPAEAFDGVSDSAMRNFYLLGIHRTLRQIDRELANNVNPSCRVGLLKAKTEVLFKLIELQQSIDSKALLKRIETLEKRLEVLASKKQKHEVKRR